MGSHDAGAKRDAVLSRQAQVLRCGRGGAIGGSGA